MSKFKPSRTLATATSNFPASLPPVRARNWANPFRAPQPVPSVGEASNTLLDGVFQDRVQNPTRQFAFKCTLVFLFFRFSFLHELLSSKLHFDTHILVVFGAISYFAAFLAGGFFDATRERATWMWCAFGACMTLATVFSTWRSGSLNMLIPYLKTTLPLVLLIPAVTYTTEDICKVINTIGFAGTTTALMGLLSSDFKTGRMAFGSAGSDIQDSNDYAAHMILVLPAMAYFFFGPKRNVFFKLLGVVFLAAGLYQVFSTGSRGGLVGLIGGGLYILKRGSSKVRLAILVGLPALGLFAFTLIPRESAQRLKSLFGSSDDVGDAIASREARTALFWASVHITLHHPLLGIGPGEFMDYQAGMATQKGERGMWHETHNAYTQISSECGIPALFFYFAAVGITYISLRRVTKSHLPVISTIANILSIMMVGYSVCIVFLSHGFNFSLPVITGIATSLNRYLPDDKVQRELSYSGSGESQRLSRLGQV